jgi:hypothetical protein
MKIRETVIATCINHQYRVVYIHIPKNAGTSIRGAFFRGKMTQTLATASSLKREKEIIKYKCLGYKTFTVWRMDVVDRLKTAYIEDCVRADKDMHYLRDMRWYSTKHPKERFLTYLSEIEEQGGFGHCIKQTDAVKNHEGNIHRFDYNFTMDTLSHISDVLFNGVHIPRRKSNHNKKQSIASFFTKDVIAKINEIYVDDTIHLSNMVRDGQLWKV